MNNSYLILWNKNNFSDKLAKAFRKKKVITLITSKSDFERNLKRNNVQGIVILAELNWNGKKLSDFYGFEILCKLRTEHRLKCPIAICSFMPEPWLRKKFPILDFPQNHPFIRLPASPETFVEKIKKAEVADEFRLNDIITSYCDPKGKLRNLINHGGGFRQIIRANEKLVANKSFFNQCKSDLALFEEYINGNLFNKNVIEIGQKLITEFKQALQSKNTNRFLEAKQLFLKLLDELSANKDNNSKL